MKQLKIGLRHASEFTIQIHNGPGMIDHWSEFILNGNDFKESLMSMNIRYLQPCTYSEIFMQLSDHEEGIILELNGGEVKIINIIIKELRSIVY